MARTPQEIVADMSDVMLAAELDQAVAASQDNRKTNDQRLAALAAASMMARETSRRRQGK